MPDGSYHEDYVKEFVPDPSCQREFRDALGQFSTGVTIVTALGARGPIGMTANSFTAVSLDPPLVMWCPAKASARFPVFAEATHFAIHVLAASQKGLADRFARQGNGFEGLGDLTNDDGVPVIPDSLARFDCSLFDTHDAGDHAIVVGRVENVSRSVGRGLVFANGQFGSFSDF